MAQGSETEVRRQHQIRIAIVSSNGLSNCSLPMDEDKSFEVCRSLMLGHPHQRIILPPSVEAKCPNGKTIGAKRSHDVHSPSPIGQKNQILPSLVLLSSVVGDQAGKHSRPEKGISEQRITTLGKGQQSPTPDSDCSVQSCTEVRERNMKTKGGGEGFRSCIVAFQTPMRADAEQQ